MPTPLESLFERYSRSGDPALLAEIFDRAAPELLRVAFHLVGDATRAEDLLQGTFLAAMQQAPAYDSRRPLLPWLAGILANQARRMRRDEGRAPDPDRLEPRQAPPTPLELAEGEELRAELVRAIDELPEPYRQPMLLRARHGLAPAEIAHVLGRSPGTVRVQLHRGAELLRRALPAGLVASVGLWLAPTRGLAAVRTAVLQQAASLVPATALTASAATIGGVLVWKKLAIAAALAAVLALSLVPFLPASGPAPAEPVAAAPEPALEPLPPPRALASDPAALTAAALPEERAPAEPAATDDSPRIRGVVVNGITGEPLAGVEIAVHRPRTSTWREILREWRSHVVQQGNGTLRFPYEWLQVPRELSAAMRLGRDPVPLFAPPTEGTEPLARLRTDALGHFELPFPAAGCVLVCEHSGFGERTVPFLHTQGLPIDVVDIEAGTRNVSYVPTAGGEGRSRIALWPPRRLAGYVIDEDGERIDRPITVRFYETTQHPFIGGWEVETGPDGGFNVLLPAGRVQAESLTPGWAIGHVGMHPERRQRWVFSSSFVPGEELEPAILVAVPVAHAVLRVTDRETGEPIEDFHLMSRTQDVALTHCGAFHAPGGELSLVDGVGRADENQADSRTRDRLSMQIWAAGYGVESLEVTNLMRDVVVEARLSPGELPRQRGRVLDAGSPVTGAEVALIAGSCGNAFGDYVHVLDAAATAPDGSFELCAPAGGYVGYVLRLRWRERRIAIPLDVPSPDLLVDLSRMASVTVLVRDARGMAVEDHAVSVKSPGHCGFSGRTDAEGTASFADISPGRYRFVIPYRTVPPNHSWQGDEVREVELAPGQRRIVEFSIPRASAQRLHPRLVVDEREAFASFEGWRARDVQARTGWVSVELDGTVPIDVHQLTFRMLEIEAPDRRSWQIHVPSEPPDPYEIRLRLEGPRYEGRCVDWLSGEPLARIRVIAEPRGEATRESATPSTVTDREGGFVLAGLEQREYTLRFSDRSYGWQSYGSRLEGVAFDPAFPPTSAGTQLDLRLPRLRPDHRGFEGIDSKAITGAVASAGPHQRFRMWAEARIPLPPGTLRLLHRDSSGETDEHGRYRLEVPVAPAYEASAWPTQEDGLWPRPNELREAWIAASPGDEAHDFPGRE